jgi:hypothetical protein
LRASALSIAFRESLIDGMHFGKQKEQANWKGRC